MPKIRTRPRGDLKLVAVASVAASLAIGAPILARAVETGGHAAATAVPDDRSSLRLARALRVAGDPASAVRIYRPLLARKAAAPELQLEFGNALMDAGLVDEAIGAFTAVPVGSTSAAEAQLGLARAQLKLNQPAKALEFSQRAATLAPNDERILVGLGVALDRMGRHGEAQVRYRAALVSAPRSVAARNDLALSLALGGKYDEATDILAPIARSASATAADRQNLAFVYGMKGDHDAALALSRIDLSETASQANARFFTVAAQSSR